jgi:hypothetical protein
MAGSPTHILASVEASGRRSPVTVKRFDNRSLRARIEWPNPRSGIQGEGVSTNAPRPKVNAKTLRVDAWICNKHRETLGMPDSGPMYAQVTPASLQDAVLTRMAAVGLITLPSRKGPLPRFEPIRVKGKPLFQTIIEDRNDRV